MYCWLTHGPYLLTSPVGTYRRRLCQRCATSETFASSTSGGWWGKQDGDKGTTNYILDLDGCRHMISNKSDIMQRKKDLGFLFRTVDEERWEFIMGSDFLPQVDHNKTMIVQYSRLRASRGHESFNSCGYLDRFQDLNIQSAEITTYWPTFGRRWHDNTLLGRFYGAFFRTLSSGFFLVFTGVFTTFFTRFFNKFCVTVACYCCSLRKQCRTLLVFFKGSLALLFSVASAHSLVDLISCWLKHRH